MPKLHEIIDSLNDENVSEVKEQLKFEANALHESNKQLYSRAKKAEGFEQDGNGKWVKKIEPKPEPKPEQPPQSNEPDYAKEAFLEQRGVKHITDKKLIYEEAKRLKLPLTDVLEMDHIKAKLKISQDQREAEAGMPEGGGKPGGANKSSIEHWIDKKNPDGTFATPDDLELANKVIDARVKRQSEENKFSDELYS